MGQARSYSLIFTALAYYQVVSCLGMIPWYQQHRAQVHDSLYPWKMV